MQKTTFVITIPHFFHICIFSKKANHNQLYHLNHISVYAKCFMYNYRIFNVPFLREPLVVKRRVLSVTYNINNTLTLLNKMKRLYNQVANLNPHEYFEISIGFKQLLYYLVFQNNKDT